MKLMQYKDDIKCNILLLGCIYIHTSYQWTITDGAAFLTKQLNAIIGKQWPITEDEPEDDDHKWFNSFNDSINDGGSSERPVFLNNVDDKVNLRCESDDGYAASVQNRRKSRRFTIATGGLYTLWLAFVKQLMPSDSL